MLAEAEDHLREAAADIGEEAAVARFGPADVVARGFRRVAALRLAALAVLTTLALPVLGYPLVENSLPPAPWPSEQAMPGHLRWKLDAIEILYLIAVGAGGVAVLLLRRAGRELVVACSVVAAILVLVAALSGLLAIQWADAVLGTPGWLVLVALAQLAATLGAATTLVLAARPHPA